MTATARRLLLIALTFAAKAGREINGMGYWPKDSAKR